MLSSLQLSAPQHASAGLQKRERARALPKLPPQSVRTSSSLARTRSLPILWSLHTRNYRRHKTHLRLQVRSSRHKIATGASGA